MISTASMPGLAQPTSGILEELSLVDYLKFGKIIIDNIISEQGTIDIGGRMTYYVIHATFKHFKWRYFCKMMDVKSGLRARADDLKSKSGALEHCLVNMANELRSHGLLK
eukprot:TRINITY_DN10153_c0_g1_i1.p1 TRINITY_DN10153_c0_g1~~TRINITY_DN10153_c0_g1_i1.p1  ORF type:complete len:118 (-),score=11.73 TRINITY_DN10153_c0_g1_i1:313-642(-)